MKRKKPAAIKLGQPDTLSVSDFKKAQDILKKKSFLRTFDQTISASNLLNMLYVTGTILDNEEIVNLTIQGIDIKVLPDQSIPLKITVKKI